MVQMGFQYLGTRGMRSGYERLGKQRCWVKFVNGRLRGIRLSRSKRLSLKAFTISKIMRMYNDVVNRMNLQQVLGNAAVVIPTQWGLPVISHHHHPSVL
ncbi:hypothetical protein HN51_014795 [Arachis hypogaea]|nr:uncharacterized protein DS421_6g177000 [Arachis hypogaea]